MAGLSNLPDIKAFGASDYNAGDQEGVRKFLGNPIVQTGLSMIPFFTGLGLPAALAASAAIGAAADMASGQDPKESIAYNGLTALLPGGARQTAKGLINLGKQGIIEGIGNFAQPGLIPEEANANEQQMLQDQLLHMSTDYQ